MSYWLLKLCKLWLFRLFLGRDAETGHRIFLFKHLGCFCTILQPEIYKSAFCFVFLKIQWFKNYPHTSECVYVSVTEERQTTHEQNNCSVRSEWGKTETWQTTPDETRKKNNTDQIWIIITGSGGVWVCVYVHWRRFWRRKREK